MPLTMGRRPSTAGRSARCTAIGPAASLRARSRERAPAPGCRLVVGAVSASVASLPRSSCGDRDVDTAATQGHASTGSYDAGMDWVTIVEEQGTALGDAAAVDLGAPVPAAPGWDVS